jgi:hypothetical protein
MKRLVIKSFFYTGYFRFRILFTPFNKLAKKIGAVQVETVEEEVVNKKYVSKVRRAVIMTSKNTPWESLCLVQALTAQRLLKSKLIDNTVYLGIRKDENKKLAAHAWLRCGDKIVVGEKGMQYYSVVAKFGSIY